VTLVRTRPIVSTIALFAVLVLTGARTLHSEPTVFDHSVTKTATVTPGPCWLCDSPDCAVVTSSVMIEPPQVQSRTVAFRSQQAHIWVQESPLHVRPPPTV
jgi:hypothetical protein